MNDSVYLDISAFAKWNLNEPGTLDYEPATLHLRIYTEKEYS